MKVALAIATRLPGLAAIIAAGWIAASGHDGWGWFLAVAVLLL